MMESESRKKKQNIEYINLNDNPNLLNPKLKIKDIKARIKAITNIEEKNQKFQIKFDFALNNCNEELFWKYVTIQVYNAAEYRTSLTRNTYHEDIILDLNKKIGELKKIVSEQTKVPVHRIDFQIYQRELNDNIKINSYNLFEEKLLVKINKSSINKIKIKYPDNEIKEIKTDLYNTGMEFLEEIQGDKIIKNNDIEYYILFNNEKINVDNTLINAGVKDGDIIELKYRGNKYEIFIKTLTGNTLTFNAEPSDKIIYIKSLIHYFEGIPCDQQVLIYGGKQLEETRTFNNYGIPSGACLHLVLRLKGG